MFKTLVIAVFAALLLASPVSADEYRLKWAVDTETGPDFASQPPYRGVFTSKQECEAFAQSRTDMKQTVDGKPIVYMCYRESAGTPQSVSGGKYQVRYIIGTGKRNVIHSMSLPFQTVDACYAWIKKSSATEFASVRRQYPGQSVTMDCWRVRENKNPNPDPTIEGDECDGC